MLAPSVRTSNGAWMRQGLLLAHGARGALRVGFAGNQLRHGAMLGVGKRNQHGGVGWGAPR